MNDVKIKINNLGPIKDSEFEIKRVTVIKTEEDAKILTKRFLNIILSTLAYSIYNYKRDIAELIYGSEFEMRKECRYLSQCLSILRTVLLERKDSVRYDFIKRIYKEACDIVSSHIKQSNQSNKDFPKSNKMFKENMYYMKENLFLNYHKTFDLLVDSKFKSKMEFKKILKSDESLLKMFEDEKDPLYAIEKLKYFNGSTIELSGILFDKKIDSEFAIKNGQSKIRMNKEFYDFFNPNEIVLLETKMSKDYEFPDFPASIMREVYHSSSYEPYDHYRWKKVEELVEGEFYQFYKIIGGKFFNDFGKMVFKSIEEYDEDIFKNNPLGMNHLAKLQLLFSNKFLIKDSILILDNVEYYLTPKWQDKLAKLLIAMAKELKISICLFSNNDDFIKLIEKYTKKYGLEDESNFYLSS